MLAAQRLVDRGVGAVLATLGAAGAVLVNAEGSRLATPPPIVPRSTVGAGDSSLAGYVRADVGSARAVAQRLQMAVAYGSAAAALPGSALPTPAEIDLEAVRVTPISSIPSANFASSLKPTESIAMTSTASRPIIDAGLVLLDVDAGADKQAVIARLVGSLADAGRTSDADGLISARHGREEQSATGPGGIAIPHCRSPHVETASIGFARLAPPVDFGAPDGPADLAFLIAAPEAGGAEHMKLLLSLARALVRKEFVQSLRDASSADEVVGLVDEVLNPAEKPTAAAPVEKPAAARPKTLIAITACPTGIAHTYMAADSLVAAAKEAGVTLHVETQGSSGSTPLDASTIAGADAVIFATDVGVKDKGRFAGKPVIASGVKRAINEPAKMVAEAVAAAGTIRTPPGWRVAAPVRRPAMRPPVVSAGAPAPADPAQV